MPVPRWKYRFTKSQDRERIDVPAMLREWHSAMRLGYEIESLEINGEPVPANLVMLLNVWVQSWGAWRASRQSYFQAWEQLERVLRGARKAKCVRRRLSQQQKDARGNS